MVALRRLRLRRRMDRGKASAGPRWAIDMPRVAPASKPAATIKKTGKYTKKFNKPPEKPEKIEALLKDPARRKHLGPCCVSADGSVRGTKQWGDGGGAAGFLNGKACPIYECMGCRKILDNPEDDNALLNAMVDAALLVANAGAL